jgi:hypothetical protein
MSSEGQPTSIKDQPVGQPEAGTIRAPESPLSPARPSAILHPTTLELVTKLAVLGSVAVYLMGFIVAVHWYTKSGVPVSALTHDVFLAAGVQFAVVCLSALSPLLAYFLTAQPPSPAASPEAPTAGFRRLLHRIRGGLPLLGTVLVLLSLPQMAVFHLTGASSFGHSALFVVVTFGWGLLTIRMWRKDRSDAVWKFGLLAVGVVWGATYFSTFLYSRSPRWLGGARPQLLVRHDPTTDDPTLGDASVRCDSIASGPETRCRTVYLVYWDEKYTYMAITEATTPCAPAKGVKPASWDDDIDTGARLCYVRLAAEKLSPLRIPGPLPGAY